MVFAPAQEGVINRSSIQTRACAARSTNFGTSRGATAFAKWQRLLSPEQYEIAEARTSRGVSRMMLFSKAIIQAE